MTSKEAENQERSTLVGQDTEDTAGALICIFQGEIEGISADKSEGLGGMRIL